MSFFLRAYKYDVKVQMYEEEINEEGAFAENAAVVYVAEKGRSGFKAAAVILYLAGAALLLMGSLFLYLRDSRLFREGLPMPEQEKEKLLSQAVGKEEDFRHLRKVRFQISDRTATPVTYGLFRPAVVFPKGLYLKDEREVGFCLQHELIHIKNHDNLKKLAAHLALCIHWFNPLVWVMYFLFNRDMELLCDETVVRRSGESRQEYALALLSMAQYRSLGFQTGLGFGKSAVKERIAAVMTFRKTTLPGLLAAVTAVTSALTVFVTNSAAYVQDGVETAAAGEYAVLEDTGAQGLTWGEQSAVIAVTGDVPSTWNLQEQDGLAYAEYAVEAVTMTMTGYTAEESTVALSGEAAMDDTVYEGEGLEEGMEETIAGLLEELGIYGLSAEVDEDDYQFYYKGEPVYFLADNKRQSGEGFSGRLFMRPADGQNGYTGVITEYNENGEITGLIHLSAEESERYTSPWR